jgi:hypothetical protein
LSLLIWSGNAVLMDGSIQTWFAQSFAQDTQLSNAELGIGLKM